MALGATTADQGGQAKKADEAGVSIDEKHEKRTSTMTPEQLAEIKKQFIDIGRKWKTETWLRDVAEALKLQVSIPEFIFCITSSYVEKRSS